MKKINASQYMFYGLLLLFSGSLNAMEERIASFDDGSDGFYSIQIDQKQKKAGKASARLENKSKKWVISTRNLHLTRQLNGVEFWVNSTDINKLAVRIADSTGQYFQPRVNFKADGSWQKISVTDFTSEEIFGGARDKKIHHPVKKLELVLEGKGTVWFDEVTLMLEDDYLPEVKERMKQIRQAKILQLGDFSKGSTDGFTGELSIAKGAGEKGKDAACLINRNKKWVEAAKAIDSDVDHDFLQVSFNVKSEDVASLAIRCTDHTGQAFQQRVQFAADGKWHTINIDELGTGQHWGGAKDGKWHAPMKEIRFILESKGTLLINDIQARLNPKPVVYDLRLKTGAPSNVFLQGESVKIPMQTKGSSATYIVTDYWQKEIAKGTLEIKDNAAVIPAPSGNGYYLIHVEASDNAGKKIASAYTSYAVIPRIKIQDKSKSPFAAMTHYAQKMPLQTLPVLAKAGVTMIRDEMYWGGVEKQKGQYRIPDYAKLYMSECKKNNITTLIEMTFENKLYDNGNTPYTDQGCKAYANYGSALVDHYPNQIKWLEVWNEYNGSWCKGSAAEDKPKYYTKMLKATYETVKSKHPEVKILGGAAVLIPLPFFRKMFEHGALDYMDAVVIHPYRKRPEGVGKEVKELREMIRKFNNGKEKPIWATETGLKNLEEFDWEKGKSLHEKGRKEVASYLVRQYALLLSQNVTKIFWYLAADHGPFKTMGLLRHENDKAGKLVAAAPYAAYAVMVSQLHDAQCLGREKFGDYTRTFAIRFHRGNNEDILVCWATYPGRIRINSKKDITQTDIMGRQKVLQIPANGLELEVGADPVYFSGSELEIAEIESPEKIIASTVDEYSKTQGANGWQYGYFEIDSKNENVSKPQFKPMKVVETMWGEVWKGEGKFLNLGAGGGHPEIAGNKQLWPVRRWTSPYSGEVTITGKCSRDSSKGDGVIFVIFKDGQEILRKMIGGMNPLKITINKDLKIEKGTVIDFCIAPKENTHYDSTNFDLMIKTVVK